MDQEMKDYLDRMHQDIKSTVEDKTKTLEVRIKDNADISLQSHEATRKQVNALGGMVKKQGKMVEHLWREVKGSDPPPDPDDRAEPPAIGAVPMDEKLSEHDLQLASIQGQVIAIGSQVNGLREAVVTKEEHDQLKSVVENVEKLQVTQVKAMGLKTEEQKAETPSVFSKLADLFVWMVKEREGQKFALSALAAITGLVTAMGTTYALLTGRLPLPTGAPPTVQQPYGNPSPAPPQLPPRPPPPGGAQAPGTIQGGSF